MLEENRSWKVGSFNRSGVYILPMLADVEEELKGSIFPKSNFKNCFIGDIEFPDDGDKIYLLYKFDGKSEYLDFEKSLLEHPDYHSMYEPDSRHTMYVFNVPERWKHNYQMFKRGSFSLFTNDYKQHIKAFFALPDKHSVMGTLYKYEWRFKELEKLYGITIPRDLEACPMPDWYVENYRPEFKFKKAMHENNKFHEGELDRMDRP